MKKEINVYTRGSEDGHTDPVIAVTLDGKHINIYDHEDLDASDAYIRCAELLPILKSVKPRTNEDRVAFLERETFYIDKHGVATYYARDSISGCNALPTKFDSWESCVDALMDLHEGV